MLKIRTPLETVSALMDRDALLIEADQFNRYCIISKENRLSRAFCFGVPVIREASRQIITPKISHDRGITSFVGSSANIRIDQSIKMSDRHGGCEIIPDGLLYKKAQNSVFLKSSKCQTEVFPTLNGVAIKISYLNSNDLSFRMRIRNPLQSIRKNDRCIAFMRGKFIPLVTVSCIGTLNTAGDVVAPCGVAVEKLNDQEYRLKLFPQSKTCKSLMLEINMQETKLFQDTTVESRNPTVNNAFGGTAFIGTTKGFGEQWLYSRLMLSNIHQLSGKRIARTVLHIPVLNGNTQPLTLNSVVSRFCSFGSTWENKIPLSKPLAESSVSNGYHHLDVTHLLGRMEQKTQNYVIKSKELIKKPIIISTGDSSLLPQILEVQYQ